VNAYSTESFEGVQYYETLNYSFQQSCLDECFEEKINNLEFLNQNCDCESEKVADSITLKIYGTVFGYFEGLTNLSDNDLTSYKTDALTNALSEGDFGSITIKKEHVESYTKVSQLLIHAFTDSYRKKKIKNYVKEANAPIKALISFLDFNISSNLNGKLEVKKNRLKLNYFDLIKEPSLSSFEKRQTIKEYYNTISEIEQQQAKFIAYSKTLSAISLGHQKLYDDIEHLSTKTIKQELFESASEIKSIISELKKI
jgi:2C-methyl-D-erythritol 2,4-cyclodiphosphate synthase